MPRANRRSLYPKVNELEPIGKLERHQRDSKYFQNIFIRHTRTPRFKKGAEKVGKTNIITRFVKDEFTEVHNMTLEGQQSTVVNVDNRRFQILVHDTAGSHLFYFLGAINIKIRAIELVFDEGCLEGKQGRVHFCVCD